MRRASLLLVSTLLLAGCSSDPKGVEVPLPASEQGLDRHGFAPVEFGSVRFLEEDLGTDALGNLLHADVFLPDAPLNDTAPTKFPAILLMSPYWGDGTGGGGVNYMPYDFLVERLVPRGYAVVFGDLAGNGGSGGCWDFMGPVETASSVGMVEAIAAQPWSDGKVGMFGLSYDGMTQVMAASAQAPHLTTVVPAAALTEAYRGLHKGGVHYNGGWHTTVVGYEASTLFPRTTEARRAGWLETLQASPQCLADNHAGTTPPGAYTPYYQERDFRALGAKVNASVFVTQGFLDGAVKPDNFGAWFENVPTAKKAWLGFWYHQYPTAANAGRDDMYLAFHRWFDSELKGIDNGIHDGPVVEVQDSLGGWRGEEAWPPRDATRTAFALSADGALTAPEAAQEGRLSFGGPASAADLLLRGGQGRLRVSTQLPSDMHIAGVPRLNVTFVPQGPEAQVIARVWDGDRLVTQGALNLLYTSDPSSPRPVVPGTPVRALLELYPTDWVLQAGRTLTLELSTVDAYGWFDEGTAATVAVQTGPEATLELPTVVRSADDRFLVSCGAALRDEVPGCFLDLADRGV